MSKKSKGGIIVGEKILLVEDDPNYLKNLQLILEQHGYKVDTAVDAIYGIELFGENKYDLVISDLKMEVMDGNRFLAFVKRVNPKTKSIILTGEPDPTSQLESLDIDVNQYLDKSIRMDVLIRYIEKILEAKSSSELEKKEYHSETEELSIDMRGRTVTVRGEDVYLTSREFGILVMLLRDKGKAIRRQEFIDELWDNRFEDVDQRVVDVHIKLIRKKLKVSSIVSIRGYGYKWDE